MTAKWRSNDKWGDKDVALFMQVRLSLSQPTFYTGTCEVCNRPDDSQRLIGQSPSGVLNLATK